jgi:hypothetical protein
MVKDKKVNMLVEEMKKYQWLLQFYDNRKIKMLYFLNKFFGYYNLIRCMKIYSKIRKG